MYTNITTVKSYLGDVQGSGDDALLTGFIAASASIIDNYCHTTFEALSDGIHYFDAVCDVDGRTLYLDGQLCGVTSVVNGDGATVAATNFVTEPRNQTPWYALTMKKNSSVMWTYTDTPEKAIIVSGKWAYSLTAPADIQQAAMRLAAYLYRQRDNGFDLDRMIQTQNGVVTPFGLPVDLRELLAPYKRIVTS